MNTYRALGRALDGILFFFFAWQGVSTTVWVMEVYIMMAFLFLDTRMPQGECNWEFAGPI